MTVLGFQFKTCLVAHSFGVFCINPIYCRVQIINQGAGLRLTDNLTLVVTVGQHQAG